MTIISKYISKNFLTMFFGILFGFLFVIYVWLIVHCGFKLKRIRKRYEV